MVKRDVLPLTHFNIDFKLLSNVTSVGRVGIVGIETSIDPSVIKKLEEMGHKIIVGNGFFGRFQAIMKDPDTGVYYGASESRVDGQAAGD